MPRFLAEMRIRYPDHDAFVFLGFTTGLRPSSLRPLRRSGPNADIKWEDGKLLVRRSNTRGNEVMESTKTGRSRTQADLASRCSSVPIPPLLASPAAPVASR